MSAAAQAIVNAIHNAFGSPDSAVRIAAVEELQQFVRSDATLFFKECAGILASPGQFDFTVRYQAVCQIKKYIRPPSAVMDDRTGTNRIRMESVENYSKQCAESMDVIQAILLSPSGVSDPEKLIRKVSAGIVSSAVCDQLWPVMDVLGALCSTLQSKPSPAAVHGAMMALAYTTDDAGSLLDATPNAMQQVVSALLPYVKCTATANEPEILQVHQSALEAMATILDIATMEIEKKNSSFISTKGCVGHLIDSCFENLTTFISTPIATASINCIRAGLVHEDQVTDAYFNGRIVPLMVQATTQKNVTDEDFRIAAVLFWSTVLNYERLAQLAGIQVPQILPTLIDAIQYSDMELGSLNAGGDDITQPDDPKEIRPRHYQSTVQQTQENDDENDGDDDEVEEWNLRRVSARTLDDISAKYGTPILEPALNVIRLGFAPSSDWKSMEAAILALGAIAAGCRYNMGAYLPELSNQLLAVLETANMHSLVLATTFWTCSEYVEFLVTDPQLMSRYLQQILRHMSQNPSKRVQESATESLESLVEHTDVTPFATDIMSTCIGCLRRFQVKNRILLLEALVSICDRVAQVLRYDDQILTQLLTALQLIWQSVDTDPEFGALLRFPLYDCMGAVCKSFGHMMPPDAVGSLVNQALQQFFTYLQQLPSNPEVEDFVVTAMDLLSGIFDGVGAGVEPYIQPHRKTLIEALMTTLRALQYPCVVQSGFALCGDVARSIPAYLQEALAPFTEALVGHLQQPITADNYLIISNLCWSLGLFLENETSQFPTLRESQELNMIYGLLAQHFTTVQGTPEMQNMEDNMALALGVILCMDVDVAQRTNISAVSFGLRFCEKMRVMKSDDLPQKATALKGFLYAVQYNPSELLPFANAFIGLACSGLNDPEVLQMMKQMLQGMAQANRNVFAAYRGGNSTEGAILRSHYGVL